MNIRRGYSKRPAIKAATKGSSSIYLESTASERLGLLPGETRQVKQAMAVSAMTIASPHTTLGEAAALMRDLDVPAVMVYEGNHLRGMITDRDLALSHAIRNAPESAPIAQFMRTDVPTCSEEALLYDALSLMEDSNLNWLPVLNGAHSLVGLLSRYAAP
jgi:CBS domain-containing protein